MLYLKASSKIQILDSWKGRKGRFLKVFGINDQRNKNGWRVTCESIKRHAKDDIIDKPGIEYLKCEGTVCDLDHTDATTYKKNLEVQEDFRVTDIVDWYVDESTCTGYEIHVPQDEEFWQKYQRGEIRYVSPSIWPKQGAYDILGRDNKGNLMIDVYDWYKLHTAFVNKPAFGDDAKIYGQCEGEGGECAVRLLKANIDNSVPLAPLMEVPILVRHKKKLHFMSATKCVQDKIQEKVDKGIKITDQELAIVYLECGESRKSKVCPCETAKKLQQLESRLTILSLQSRLNKLSR